VKSTSKEAFRKNVKAEIKAGNPKNRPLPLRTASSAKQPKKAPMKSKK